MLDEVKMVIMVVDGNKEHATTVADYLRCLSFKKLKIGGMQWSPAENFVLRLKIEYKVLHKQVASLLLFEVQEMITR